MNKIRPNTKLGRNAQVYQMYKDGYRATAIAKKFKISRERVYAIVIWYEKFEKFSTSSK